jgi:hypothetical protein
LTVVSTLNLCILESWMGMLSTEARVVPASLSTTARGLYLA